MAAKQEQGVEPTFASPTTVEAETPADRALEDVLEAILSGGEKLARILSATQNPDVRQAALLAAVRAVGDAEELVAYRAFQLIERLFPELPRQSPELWSRLGRADDRQVRLAAAEELVRILPELEREVRMRDLSGRWIAWDGDQETVVAAADTYPELIRLLEADGLADQAVIEKAPGVHPAVAARPFVLLDDESANIVDDINRTIPDAKDAEEWLDAPNTRLWCQRPRDFIGTPEEPSLRFLLRGIRSGFTS